MPRLLCNCFLHPALYPSPLRNLSRLPCPPLLCSFLTHGLLGHPLHPGPVVHILKLVHCHEPPCSSTHRHLLSRRLGCCPWGCLNNSQCFPHHFSPLCSARCILLLLGNGRLCSLWPPMVLCGSLGKLKCSKLFGLPHRCSLRSLPCRGFLVNCARNLHHPPDLEIIFNLPCALHGVLLLPELYVLSCRLSNVVCPEIPLSGVRGLRSLP
mmetsp:Transcript_49667/g.158893  ORF Transcript_49667/g.158893 Transcript_49667/m.158893 type:complete len:210 (+) Transcript_49667:251-880(+)